MNAGLSNAPAPALDQLTEDMVEFGMSLETAQRVAPILLPLFRDPRGLRAAFIAAFPREAERRGLHSRQ